MLVNCFTLVNEWQYMDKLWINCVPWSDAIAFFLYKLFTVQLASVGRTWASSTLASWTVNFSLYIHYVYKCLSYVISYIQLQFNLAQYYARTTYGQEVRYSLICMTSRWSQHSQ